jgi:hypothetical protein
MNEEIPEFLRNETIDMSSMTSDDKLQTAQRLAAAFVELDKEIDDTEARLKELKQRKLQIAQKELPEFLDGIGLDKVGVAAANCDVVVKPYYKANISADWPAEQKEKAFSYLESIDCGDIIGVTVSVKFLRGELELAKELADMIRSSKFGNTHAPSMEMGTPWNTLTSTVKHLVESGKSVDLETLGATVGRIAKIVMRKK